MMPGLQEIGDENDADDEMMVGDRPADPNCLKVNCLEVNRILETN